MRLTEEEDDEEERDDESEEKDASRNPSRRETAPTRLDMSDSDIVEEWADHWREGERLS